jgi:hypothetical protein
MSKKLFKRLIKSASQPVPKEQDPNTFYTPFALIE